MRRVDGVVLLILGVMMWLPGGMVYAQEPLQAVETPVTEDDIYLFVKQLETVGNKRLPQQLAAFTTPATQFLLHEKAGSYPITQQAFFQMITSGLKGVTAYQADITVESLRIRQHRAAVDLLIHETMTRLRSTEITDTRGLMVLEKQGNQLYIVKLSIDLVRD